MYTLEEIINNREQSFWESYPVTGSFKADTVIRRNILESIDLPYYRAKNQFYSSQASLTDKYAELLLLSGKLAGVSGISGKPSGHIMSEGSTLPGVSAMAGMVLLGSGVNASEYKRFGFSNESGYCIPTCQVLSAITENANLINGAYIVNDISLTPIFNTEVFDELAQAHIRPATSVKTNKFSEKNIDIINSKFETEYSKYSKYITSDKEEAKKIVEKVSALIASIKFEKIVVELTPSNAIKYTIVLDNNKMLMVTKPFEKIDDLADDEVVFSLFVDKKLIISDAKKLNDLVEGISKQS